MAVLDAGALFHEGSYNGQVLSAQNDTTYRGTFEELVNGDTQVLPYGCFAMMKPGGLPGELILPTAAAITAGGALLGVVPALSFGEKNDTEEPGIPISRPATLVIEGIVGLMVEDDVVRGGDIFVRTADETTPGTFDFRGRIRSDNSGGNAVQLPAGRGLILENTTAGEIAPVVLLLPRTLI